VYGQRVALAPLTLRVLPGAVCLVTGPNGSGKTTLLRLAAGLTVPTRGARHALGSALYLGPGDGVRAAQSARQAVRFVTALAGRRAGGDEALAVVGLGELADVPSAALSSGERARISLAIALASRPAVACLDEPTAHLDADGRAVAVEVVARLAAGGAAVLVATHDEGLLGEVAGTRLHLVAGRPEPTR